MGVLSPVLGVVPGPQGYPGIALGMNEAMRWGCGEGADISIVGPETYIQDGTIFKEKNTTFLIQ